ncbi:hypothetical protein COU18_00495 [Candidatus Kaiserbacteria bacterium CG10_big_fil_rev_8_21_14_0_10_51_14]|uniref:Uncharacterized protein n=1 Tax=Candidatus Kaiserbacteria bacterium CG10_big_fil_rev_8_21_14_0_10_51_14 TaxID=1974610 RepID=A0A2H0UEW8_9BACT|nr:MAG: hypothetical protein COU18_00495 [Candidatus Kaiserbacteria bacterium CG10_big_fil_rev_8_21_14_0_10_51_14]
MTSRTTEEEEYRMIGKVLRAVGSGEPQQFSGSKETLAVVRAAHAGWLRIVLPGEAGTSGCTLHNPHWPATNGLVLTNAGRQRAQTPLRLVTGR